jgi:tetratricopeptide (TPR) repeat protein
MIYYRLGDMDNAKEHLREALSINPYFHVIYSEVAEGTLIEIESKSRAAKGK